MSTACYHISGSEAECVTKESESNILFRALTFIEFAGQCGKKGSDREDAWQTLKVLCSR